MLASHPKSDRAWARPGGKAGRAPSSPPDEPDSKGVEEIHTHVSGLTAIYIFLMVVIVGTFWRLGAAYASQRPGLLGELGKAAAVQF